MAKVLLVDDEPDILLMLRMAFEDEGHEIVMAADGRMGLERLKDCLLYTSDAADE